MTYKEKSGNPECSWLAVEFLGFDFSGVFVRECHDRGPVEVFELRQPQGRQGRDELVDPRTWVSGRQGVAGADFRFKQFGQLFLLTVTQIHTHQHFKSSFSKLTFISLK
jgi:hypothetical protein